jgi:phage FluMu protein Com
VIIIFGLRRLRKGMGPILLRCANCGMSPLVLFRVSTWFALFFIPVIPVSFKHYVACPNCKRLDQVSKTDIERAREHETAMSQSGHGEGAPVEGAPATLESAVNEWATTGPAHMTATGSVPAAAPTPSPPVAGPPPLPPAGWYPDPADVSNQRYWDGQRWTEQTAPSPSSP